MNVQAKKNKKNTIITVTVNLELLLEGKQCNDFTSFTDNRGNSNEKPQNINSRVNKGKRIFWIGVLENSEGENDFVDLLAVAKKDPNESSLLKKDFYIGKQGIIEGRVLKKASVDQTFQEIEEGEDVVMNYSISFLIGYESDEKMHYKICTIDPKIKMSK